MAAVGTSCCCWHAECSGPQAAAVLLLRLSHGHSSIGRQWLPQIHLKTRSEQHACTNRRSLRHSVPELSGPFLNLKHHPGSAPSCTIMQYLPAVLAMCIP